MGLNVIYLERDGFGLCKLNTLQLISFNFLTSIFQTEVLLFFENLLYLDIVFVFNLPPLRLIALLPLQQAPLIFRMLIFFIYEFESILQQLLIGICNNEFAPILL